jgi:thiol-disulfide isomerase/thioredoxin
MVVSFWASWCPPCLAEMPDLEAVHQLADGQVAFVGVNTQDTQDRAEDLVDQTGASHNLVRDPDAALVRAVRVFAMPTTFSVDGPRSARNVSIAASSQRATSATAATARPAYPEPTLAEREPPYVTRSRGRLRAAGATPR